MRWAELTSQRRILRKVGTRLDHQFAVDQETLFLAVVGAVIVYLVLPPLLTLFQTSFYVTNIRGELESFTLDNYLRLVRGTELVRPLSNSIVFALGSACLSLILGGCLAWIVERTNAPLRRLGYLVAMAAFAIPFVLYTISWLLLLGRRGPINTALRSVLQLDSPPIEVYSLPGMILVEGLLWSPLVFLMLSSAFHNMDASLEEAAMVSGAGTLTTFWRVTLPMVLPALLSVAMLVLIRAIESFEIPALVGLPGKVEVLTTRIFLDTKAMPPDHGGASAFSVVLIGLLLALLAYYRRVTRDASRFETITGKGFRPRTIDLGRWRYPAAALIALYFVLILVLPLLMILWTSLMPFYTAPSIDALPRVTLRNFEVAISYPKFADALRNSIILGMLSATLVLVLTSIASWVVVRGKSPLRVLLEQLGGLPLVFPGVVLGLGIMRLYLQVPIPIYATIWILLIAYVTRYVPYGMRYCHAGLLQIHRELEEAAALSGAGFWLTFRRVVLPLLVPSFLAGWMFVMLLSTKELSMSVLLAGPRSPVMSVAMFDLWNNGQVTEVAAFGVLWAAILSVIVALLYVLGKRYGIQLS